MNKDNLKRASYIEKKIDQIVFTLNDLKRSNSIYINAHSNCDIYTCNGIDLSYDESRELRVMIIKFLEKKKEEFEKEIETL